MAEGWGGREPRGAAEEEMEPVVRPRCRRGEEAEEPRGAAAGPPLEQRFQQMYLRKQVSYR